MTSSPHWGGYSPEPPAQSPRASASSAGCTTSAAAARKPSATAARRPGCMEISLAVISSGSTARIRSKQPAPARTTAAAPSGESLFTSKLALLASPGFEPAPPPSATTVFTTASGAASASTPKYPARSRTMARSSQLGILHANAAMANETWVSTVRGGASPGIEPAPRTSCSTVLTAKFHAIGSRQSRIPIQSPSPSTAWLFCVFSALLTHLRSSTCSALAQKSASSEVRSVASRNMPMDNGHAWSLRRNHWSHWSAAAR